MVSLILGYNSSNACARICAEECQKAFFPSGFSQVYNTKLPSVCKGVTVSIVFPSKLAEITLRAKPSLILRAISAGVIPFLYSLTEPSGSVTFIIFYIVLKNLAKVMFFSIVSKFFFKFFIPLILIFVFIFFHILYILK